MLTEGFHVYMQTYDVWLIANTYFLT